MKKRGYVINYILLLVCILTSLSQVQSYKTTLGQASYFDAKSIVGLSYDVAGLPYGRACIAQEPDSGENVAWMAEDDTVAAFDSTAVEDNNHCTNSLKKIDCIVSTDACTVEMLGSARSNLLNRTSAIRRNEIREKSGPRSEQAEGILTRQRTNHFYTFANLCVKITDTDTAGVIRFIHNKDGKKENLISVD